MGPGSKAPVLSGEGSRASGIHEQSYQNTCKIRRLWLEKCTWNPCKGHTCTKGYLIYRDSWVTDNKIYYIQGSLTVVTSVGGRGSAANWRDRKLRGQVIILHLWVCNIGH